MTGEGVAEVLEPSLPGALAHAGASLALGRPDHLDFSVTEAPCLLSMLFGWSRVGTQAQTQPTRASVDAQDTRLDVLTFRYHISRMQEMPLGNLQNVTPSRPSSMRAKAPKSTTLVMMPSTVSPTS